ncbi:MAG: phosphohistidine phosphatase SixA [Synergistales bacterium]|nr:phosphohistidine phosphatase SixA [Synergistales bacterium]
MLLYLIQHGYALPKDQDAGRPLSEEGRIDVGRVARFLVHSRADFGAIWHSTKLRARETAEIVAEVFPVDLEEKGGLEPRASVGPWKEGVEHYGRDLCIVGHLPFLERFASLLLLGEEGYRPVLFSPGSAICLEQSEGEWHIQFAVHPAPLRNLDS